MSAAAAKKPKIFIHGEAGTTGAIPCIANAVIHALQPLGVWHLDTPYTPNRLWRTIAAARG